MSAIPASPEITPADRLSLTLCLAIVFHAVVILGISFTSKMGAKPHYDTMDVTLVQQKSPKKPKHASVLAQANLAGGGKSADKVNPATPLPPPFPDNKAQVTAPPPVKTQPRPKPETLVKKAPQKEKAAAPKHTHILAARDAESTEAANTTEHKSTPQKSTEDKQHKQAPKQKQRTLPTAATLLANSFKIAALSAEIKQKLEARAKRPRQTFISASTQEYKYAAYMEAWRAKVERIGNLNYPEAARRLGLSGSLILDVALNADGTVHSITIRQSSGYKVLDDAAVRIVRLAAPFAPFPPDISKETDILHITRTWQFMDKSGFR